MRNAAIVDIGSIGLVKDRSLRDFPPAAWRTAKGVNFRNGVVERAPGALPLFTGVTGGCQIFATRDITTPYLVIPTAVAVWAYDNAGTPADITRAAGAYTGSVNTKWTAGAFQGLFTLNNGVDKPQLWSPISLAQVLVDLPNWPATKLAASVRPFKNFLVALDVSTGGSRDPRQILWSHPAAPGAVPSSWDVTDPTKDAGEVTLSEGDDTLIDSLPFGNVLAVYSEEQVWAMGLTGDNSVFAFDRRFDTVGMLTVGCGQSFRSKHFVVTRDDCVVHDMQSVESVADGRVRKYIKNAISSNYYGRSRTAIDRTNSRIYIALPTTGRDLDLLLCWDWVTNTWSEYHDYNFECLCTALFNPASATDAIWSSYVGDWETHSGAWGEELAQDFRNRVIILNGSGSPDPSRVILLEDTTGEVPGVISMGTLENDSLTVKGVDANGQNVIDFEQVGYLQSIWPHFTKAPEGFTCQIYLGYAMLHQQAITWLGPYSYDPATQDSVDVAGDTIQGRVFGVRFVMSNSYDWELKDYELEIAPTGMR